MYTKQPRLNYVSAQFIIIHFQCLSHTIACKLLWIRLDTSNLFPQSSGKLCFYTRHNPSFSASSMSSDLFQGELQSLLLGWIFCSLSSPVAGKVYQQFNGPFFLLTFYMYIQWTSFAGLTVTATVYSKERMVCLAPPATAGNSLFVTVQVSVNGQEYSKTAASYFYFKVSSVLTFFLTRKFFFNLGSN